MTEIDLESIGKTLGPPENAPVNGAKKGTRRPPPKRRRALAEAAHETSGSAVEAPPPARSAAPAPEKSPTPLPSDAEIDRDAMLVWPRILDEQRKLGFDAYALQCSVYRFPVGMMKGPKTILSPIDCENIQGGENVSPGEDLYNYIVHYYHRHSPGPALYKLEFMRKNGGQKITGSTCELRLDHPDIVRKQLEGIEEMKRAKEYGSGAAFPMGYPRRGAPIGVGVAPVQQAPNIANPREAELLRLLSQENGYYQGILEGRATVAPVTPPAAPVRDPRLPPEGMTAEEWDQVLAARQAKALGPVIAQAVAQTLTGMGLTPQAISQMTAGAAVPKVIPNEVPADPIKQLESMLTMLGRYEKFKTGLGRFMGESENASAAAAIKDDDAMKPILGGSVKIPGTDQPMLYGERLEDETWPQYFLRLGAHNPAMVQKVIGGLVEKLDPRVLAGIAARMASNAGPMGALPPGAARPPQQAPRAIPQRKMPPQPAPSHPVVQAGPSGPVTAPPAPPVGANGAAAPAAVPAAPPASAPWSPSL